MKPIVIWYWLLLGCGVVCAANGLRSIGNFEGGSSFIALACFLGIASRIVQAEVHCRQS